MPDQETPLGYVIGFKELYEAITRLDQKVDDRFSESAKTLANHAARLDALEHGNNRRWQMFALWVTCAVALIAAVIGMFGPLLTHA